MNRLFKTISYYAIFLLLFSSCNFSNGIYLNTEEGIEALEQLMSEKLDTETEVYTLDFSAKIVTGRLEDIAYSYEIKDKIFEDRYHIMTKTFSDPTKYPYQIHKSFKIKDAPISIIPTKYLEALKILEENGLLKEDETYYLDSWVFKTDHIGEMTSYFNLTYYLTTTQHGRVRTTNYGQYSFTMNADTSLKLKK